MKNLLKVDNEAIDEAEELTGGVDVPALIRFYEEGKESLRNYRDLTRKIQITVRDIARCLLRFTEICIIIKDFNTFSAKVPSVVPSALNTSINSQSNFLILSPLYVK
ncbi:hypothetical protein AB6A40_009972 [Gnathostoma spinigerum]|uniref:Uncharacterized protein n=1 Tax=Gnathostoma spinigerum TaxID=75299 RepID=A0ABD6F0X1_9BILA